ncbi:molybdopterin-dependent oxidoreductase [Pokkaliibacter sp. CJK22405]|uniref:nitrate reductase n=1 Tax=Pokkaliibacter sp. CJK22405 TaxID=3384615 RepID=UPI0039849D4E
MSLAKTTCPYCGVGCGITAEVSHGAVKRVSGDEDHPANQGRLCVKGSALVETLGAHDRLTSPWVDGHATSWDNALNTLVGRLQNIRTRHGDRSVAMYLSGQLLTEDYYVANKLMKGFLGSAHVDTNSRLCMASTVAGYKRAFGGDLMPCAYEDIEAARLFILVGSNAAWNHPVLFQRIAAAKAANPEVRVVVIDPRRTATCDIADLHLALKPGTDALIFNALLAELVRHDQRDQHFIDHHTQGFEQALNAALEDAFSLAGVAEATELPLKDLQQLVDWFVAEPLTLTLFSQGVNQSSSGTDKVNAILNCHLASGRLGKAGCGPFSLTGQPNAMGGREVGGLANQLAAHMGFSPEEVATVQRFWDAPNMATQEGYKAVDLFEAIERGEIKVLWIMATNPLVSMPDAERVRRALEKCELVIVSECMANTDTLALADIVLPATSWSEKDGTVTNSERRISRQRGLVPAVGDARHDWQIICEVARRLGFAEAFSYNSPVEIFREHAALSGFENCGQRAFHIGAMANLSEEQYLQLTPVQWPVLLQQGQFIGTPRLFADQRFYTDSGRARFIPITARAPLQQTNEDFPHLVNTGRVRDQWHTMTRTGRAASLMQHRNEPFIEIHPRDAERLGIDHQDLVCLNNTLGRYVGVAQITATVRPGESFIAMHWNRQFSSSAISGALMESQVDPISGQPESKQGRAVLQRVDAPWHGWLLLPGNSGFVRPPVANEDMLYWSRSLLRHSTRFKLAGVATPLFWHQWCQDHLGATPSLWLEDKARGTFRAAAIHDGQLQWMLVIGATGRLPESGWVDSLFAVPELSRDQRRQLLSTQPAEGEAQGQVICSCFQIREPQIRAAIHAGCVSTAALGKALGCGTNCGSCLPELNNLIQEESHDAA